MACFLLVAAVTSHKWLTLVCYQPVPHTYRCYTGALGRVQIIANASQAVVLVGGSAVAACFPGSGMISFSIGILASIDGWWLPVMSDSCACRAPPFCSVSGSDVGSDLGVKLMWDLNHW
jgi:tetrahydromethanopterin S-methyltransferase subunit C